MARLRSGRLGFDS